MKEGRASRTAESAAAARAVHYLYHSPTIFEDPFALEFTSPVWRRIIVTRPLRWFVFNVLLRSLLPVAAQVVARSRYAEDLLEQAIAAGVRQYVIVGAGFDSFALRRRDLEPTVRVFELDHPDTQRAKRRRLLTLGVDQPNNVEFVGIDFEHESVADGLTRSNYQPARPAFFSWLGSTPYLSNAATLGTLGSIARLAAISTRESGRTSSDPKAPNSSYPPSSVRPPLADADGPFSSRSARSRVPRSARRADQAPSCHAPRTPSSGSRAPSPRRRD